MQRALEELECGRVVSLEGEAVAHDAPDLGRSPVNLDTLLREGGQVGVAAQVPEGCGEHLQSAHAVGLVTQLAAQSQHTALVVATVKCSEVK